LPKKNKALIFCQNQSFASGRISCGGKEIAGGLPIRDAERYDNL
jgi:hypothetical protein